MLTQKIRDFFYSNYTGMESNTFQNIKSEVDSLQVDIERFSAETEQRKKQIILNHFLAFSRTKNVDEIESAIKVIEEIRKY